jgi:membrane peptidoglycan carboxypeptidase
MRGMSAPNPADAKERALDPVTILNVTDAKGQTRFDIEKNRQEQRVVEDEYTYLIWDILSDPRAQCLTFGCGGITIPGYKAAVKTGTSEPFARGHPCAGRIGETWTFAYSPDLVVGIWAGNSNNDCITDIVSTSIAFRSARDVFRMAHEGRPVTAMARPPEIVGAEGGNLSVRGRSQQAGGYPGALAPPPTPVPPPTPPPESPPPEQPGPGAPPPPGPPAVEPPPESGPE